MKMKFNRALLLLAAVAIFGAAESRGQALIANIPFDFRTPNAEMPAGTYAVTRTTDSGVPVLLLSNWQAHKRAMVVAQTRFAKDGEPQPRMVFACRGTVCSLSQIWDGTNTGYTFAAPRVKSEKEERLATVYFDRKHAGR